jgi:hypothetical protein
MKKILTLIFIVSITLNLVVPIAEAKAKVSNYGPTALCRDGTYSYSANHRGTCSHHKGVRTWYK